MLVRNLLSVTMGSSFFLQSFHKSVAAQQDPQKIEGSLLTLTLSLSLLIVYGCLLTFTVFPSVQSSHSVISDSLRPHELEHARPPCLSPCPGVHSNSCPSSQCCHPAISSSVVPFSSCPQSLPASESFPMSQLFACGGQSIGVSALASVLPKNTQD